MLEVVLGCKVTSRVITKLAVELTTKAENIDAKASNAFRDPNPSGLSFLANSRKTKKFKTDWVTFEANKKPQFFNSLLKRNHILLF